MIQLELTIASGAVLDVVRFDAREALSSLYDVSVWGRIKDPALDLAAVAGQPASFTIDAELGGKRTWTGVCNFAQQVQAEAVGESTYYFKIVPKLWLLTQRRNHRIFQHQNVRKIVDTILDEWGIARRWQVDGRLYPPLEYRVQWGESDFAFIARMLEEAGVTFLFVDGGATLLLDDAPDSGKLKDGCPLPWVDQAGRSSRFVPHFTRVALGREVRPGAFTLRDADFRRPVYPLFGKVEPVGGIEATYEQYHYMPGGTAIDVDLGEAGPTPIADDRGWVRHMEPYGDARAARGQAGERAGRRMVTFEANFVEVGPGDVVSMVGHPHEEIGEETRLLVTELEIEGQARSSPHHVCKAAFAEVPWRPRLVTPKPRIRGLHPAIVVGRPGEEVDPDEFGRVRVQFPWDREGKSDHNSSCWMHVASPWGGIGYGWENLPRVGQEVLVDFLEGDPDRPVVTARVFNATQPVPYKLPLNKTISTWKSDSSPGSNGFNEILFEDKKKQELVSITAERNLRKLVKHDESITVGRNREKHVKGHETDAVGEKRQQLTKGNRVEVEDGLRTSLIGKDRALLVKGNRTTETDTVKMTMVVKEQELIVGKNKRERIEEEVHLRVKGSRLEQIGGRQSITVGEDRHERVRGNALFEAGGPVHYLATSSEVLHGRQSATLKAPSGGFIQIDEQGVTIVGAKVKINAGGSPGSAPSASPDDPMEAAEAQVAMPPLPKIPPRPEMEERGDGGQFATKGDGDDWIEIVLLEDDDPERPVAFARYRVTAPDGKVYEGNLDSRGRALITGIPKGECEVAFPTLDGESWWDSGEES